MNIEEFRDFCMALRGAAENAPWAKPEYSDLITFSVGEKWFALLDPNNRAANLKCDPLRVIELIDEYSGCNLAWHMNKKHWIGVRLESDVPDSVIKELITCSYKLIVASLSRKTRGELGLSD